MKPLTLKKAFSLLNKILLAETGSKSPAVKELTDQLKFTFAQFKEKEAQQEAQVEYLTGIHRGLRSLLKQAEDRARAVATKLLEVEQQADIKITELLQEVAATKACLAYVQSVKPQTRCSSEPADYNPETLCADDINRLYPAGIYAIPGVALRPLPGRGTLVTLRVSNRPSGIRRFVVFDVVTSVGYDNEVTTVQTVKEL